MYTEKLMVQILDKENLKKAIKRVKKNKGAPGVDGMTIEELDRYFAEHAEEIRHQILSRTYHPQPVMRVEIPKSNGDKRLLGIPTLVTTYSDLKLTNEVVIFITDRGMNEVECVLNLNDFSKKLEDWVERIKFMGND